MINEAVPLTNRSRRIKCNTTAYPLAVISIWALQEVRIDNHFKATTTSAFPNEEWERLELSKGFWRQKLQLISPIHNYSGNYFNREARSPSTKQELHSFLPNIELQKRLQPPGSPFLRGLPTESCHSNDFAAGRSNLKS